MTTFSFLYTWLFLLNFIQRSYARRTPNSLFGITKIRGGDEFQEAFGLLARVVEDDFGDSTHAKITKGLLRLSSSQQAFKGLDGMAHEAYQRTHSGDDIDTSVAGRAQRSAARIAAAAEAMLACELVEIIQQPHLIQNDTLSNRQVLLNYTGSNVTLAKSKFSVLILYEDSYDRGAGLDHGSINSLTEKKTQSSQRTSKGRLLVVLGDAISENLTETLKILRQSPRRLKLSSGLVTNEVASVQPELYKTAGQLLEVIEPYVRHHNTSSVHFVGRSLAGGVASLAATMLDGTIPLPKSKKKRRKVIAKPIVDVDIDNGGNSTGNETKLEPLNGLGRGRSSALSLGAPPCLSSNVVAAYCTSFIYGDDIVSRTTSDTLDHLCGRLEKTLKSGFVGRNIGLMTDTLSLTVSSLKSHAHGSEGEEMRLAIPGRAYLLRPRRLGGACSIHEVGNLKKGGREALRANLLWQLHDILLSKSMWKHHLLESYIQGLDRVHLRSSTEADFY